MPRTISLSPKAYYVILLLNRLAYSYRIEDKIDILKSLVSFLIDFMERTRKIEVRKKDYADLMNIMDMLSELEARLMVFKSLMAYYDREIFLGNIYDVPKEVLEYCRVKSQIKVMEARIISKLSIVLGEQLPVSIVKPPEL